MEEAQGRSNCERDALKDVPYVAVDTELQARPVPAPPGEPEQVAVDAKTPGDGAAPAAVTARAPAWGNWTRAVAGCTPNAKKIAKKVALGAVIVVVWMALAVPIVMFYLPQDEASVSAADSVNTVDSNTCTETEVYRGVICQETLQALQPCISGDQSVDGPIFIPASGRQQEIIETQARQLIFALPLLQPSQACEDAVVPLLCLYLFRVCSSDVNGTLHQPSSQQCSVVRDDTCRSEWKNAETLLGTESLPDCTSLPDNNDLVDCQSANGTKSNTTSANDSTTATTDLQCSDDFYVNGKRCQPECGEWEEWSSSTVNTIDGFVILAMTIDVIGAAITIVASFVQYKRMLKFPTSLIFYQSFGLFVAGVIVLVGYMDRKTLFCSSKDLVKSFYNPTAYCTITGVAFSYVLLQLMFWWFCHCVMVFWPIKFPFHYRSYQKAPSFKYIHIAVLVLGLVVPGVPVGVTFATGEYVTTRFPTIVCLADNEDASFYSLILPINILVAAGTSLLIVVFYEILKVIKSKDQTRIAQAKIMIVLTYYIAMGVSALTAYTIASRNFSPFLDALLSYFVCEGAGTGESCDRSEFMKYNDPVASAISIVTLGLVPVINLVYVVKFRGISASCRGWCGHKGTRAGPVVAAAQNPI